MNVESVLSLVEIVAVITFAVSGAMTGIKNKLDLFGVMFLGTITAFGGGVTRDILLGNFPPLMFRDYKYLIVAVVTSLIVFGVAYFSKEKYENAYCTVDKINNIFDAVGLGLFTVIGVQTAMDSAFSDNAFFCIFLGMTTGVGGGIIRDIMTQSLPSVFRKRIYAVASIIGAVVFYFLQIYGIEYIASLIVSCVVVFVIRMLATYYKWNMPTA